MHNNTQIYKTRTNELSGSSLEEVVKRARREFHLIEKHNPRRSPYVRSKHFKKDKILISNFWAHTNQKPARDKLRRIKLFSCAIELICNSQYPPITTQDTNNSNELLHKFYGLTESGKSFAVQIKSNKKTGRKDFISAYPVKTRGIKKDPPQCSSKTTGRRPY